MFDLKYVGGDVRPVDIGVPLTEGEVALFTLNDPALPHPVEAHYAVEDVIAALPKYIRLGYTVAIEPFEFSMGKCAVIEDAVGTRICVIDRGGAIIMPEGQETDTPLSL
jgi:hypothetical protein